MHVYGMYYGGTGFILSQTVPDLCNINEHVPQSGTEQAGNWYRCWLKDPGWDQRKFWHAKMMCQNSSQCFFLLLNFLRGNKTKILFAFQKFSALKIDTPMLVREIPKFRISLTNSSSLLIYGDSLWPRILLLLSFLPSSSPGTYCNKVFMRESNQKWSQAATIFCQIYDLADKIDSKFHIIGADQSILYLCLELGVVCNDLLWSVDYQNTKYIGKEYFFGPISVKVWLRCVSWLGRVHR